MAKVHDKYVVELAEIIKGYGNDPDINDPFCLSEFYRFYEVPNVCVSAENFKKMRPLSDYTEEIEPGSISFIVLFLSHDEVTEAISAFMLLVGTIVLLATTVIEMVEGW